MVSVESNLRLVIAHALWRTYAEIRQAPPAPKTSRHIGEAWLRSLRESFAEMCWQRVEPPGIAVFGGKPRKGQPGKCPTGVPSWSRWEYLCDVAVTEIEAIPAGFKKSESTNGKPNAVSRVSKAVWLVESEIEHDRTAIAEDLGKLKITTSDHKLLLAPNSQKKYTPQQWLEFLGHAAKGIRGQETCLFLGLMPTYSSRYTPELRLWQTEQVVVTLYKCESDGSVPQPLGDPIRAADPSAHPTGDSATEPRSHRT